MTTFSISSLGKNLSKTLSTRTSFLGLKLWVLIVACAVLLLLIIIVTVFLWKTCRRKRTTLPISNNNVHASTRFASQRSSLSHNAWDRQMSSVRYPNGQLMHSASARPNLESHHDGEISKNVQSSSRFASERRLLSRNGWEREMSVRTPKEQVTFSDHDGAASDGANNTELGSVNKFSMREMEIATDGFTEENVIGRGNHGAVYRGELTCGSIVAIKNFYISNRSISGFLKQVEEMWLIKHKNLVKVIGYCVDETYKYRMLVYEHIDNGNLREWLNHCVNDHSPLTWNIRMNIILGTAKGLAYLHEDIEPAIVHQNLKSSNILLDQEWNPKISDFGVAKLLAPEWSPDLESPRGNSSYSPPESVRCENSDIYSFGILLIEIISGKTSTVCTVNEKEEYLVDWLKSMVEEQNYDQIIDPRLPEFPSMKELKRLVLVALRCVDFEVENRPTMGEIIHMMQPRDFLLTSK